MIKKNRKTLLIAVLLIAIISSVVFANFSQEVLAALPTFVKEGEVVVLSRDNDRYFLRTEYFDEKGQYVKPAMERELDILEYNMVRSALDYDVSEIRLSRVVKGEKLSIYQIKDREGNDLPGNYVHKVKNGDDTQFEYQEGINTILQDNNGRYFVKTIFVGKDGLYSNDANIVEISKENFENKKQSREFNLLEEINHELKDGKKVFNIKHLDKNFNLIKPELITEDSGFDIIKDYLIDANNNLEEGETPILPTPEEDPDFNEDDFEWGENDNNWWDEDDEWADPTPEPDDNDNSINDDDIMDLEDLLGGGKDKDKDKPDEKEEWTPPKPKPNKPSKPAKPIKPNEQKPLDKPNSGNFWDNMGFDSVDKNKDKNKVDFDEADEQYNKDKNEEDIDQIINDFNENTNNDINKNETNEDELKEDEYGYIDDKGNKIETDANGKVKTSVEGDFDLDGNFYPKGTNYYFDPDGYRHEIEDFSKKGSYDIDGNFVIYGQGYFDETGLWHPKEETRHGYYDNEGNFVFYDGTGYLDKDGFYHKSVAEDNIRYNPVEIKETTKLITDKFGRLKVIGMKGYFNNDGLYNSPNGKKGYFNSRGEFREDKENQYKVKDGFYDEFGNWYKFTDFYKDNLGVTKVVLSPDLNLRIEDNKIKIGKLVGSFDANGLYTENGRTGYFDANGGFVESKNNPYVGGFYSNSEWIHDTFIEEINGNINLSLGSFDNKGNYTTAYGDKGHFNNKGIFKEFVLNTNDAGFYDNNGQFIKFGRVYKDEFDNVRTLGEASFYTKSGVKVNGEYAYGENTPKGKLMYNGVVINDKNELGYFNELGEFIKGKLPFKNGYFNHNKVYVNAHESTYKRNENTTILGKIIAQNDTLILPDGIKIKAQKDESGTYMVGGIGLSTEGQLGFYNTNGEFKDLQNNLAEFVVEQNNEIGYYNQNGDFIKTMEEKGFYDDKKNYHYFNENKFFDKNGNIQDEDGEIYYKNKDGEMVRGTNPYTNGFYVDANQFVGEGEPQLLFFNHLGEEQKGNTLPNSKGFYDKFKNFHAFSKSQSFVKEAKASKIDKDTKVLDNGTVIEPNLNVSHSNNKKEVAKKEIVKGQEVIFLKDKTAILEDNTYGVFNEDNNFTKQGEVEVITEKSYLLPDGRIVSPDGKVIDENGKVGKLDVDMDGIITLGEGKFLNKTGDIGVKETYKGYVDSKGTVYRAGTDAIGYKGLLGHFYPNDTSGYFDSSGTYHAPNQDFGYYDKEGNFYKGEENVYLDGFYDKHRNWLPFGHKGYYKEDGSYITSVEDILVGYYNKDGILIKGTNPYIRGYYDEDNNWHQIGLDGVFLQDGSYKYITEGTEKIGHFDVNGNIADGPNPFVDGHYNEKGLFTKFINGHNVIYFNKAGEAKEGVSPYIDGFYDSLGGWHAFGQKGVYSKKGTFYDTKGNKGYYDKQGNYRKGYNPYLYGFYDVENNWHPFASNGYYSSDGTYNDATGNIGYYTEDGTFIKDKRATNPEGFYDEFKNFILFNENGFYNQKGEFIDDMYYDSRFEYGSPNYIYNPGYFVNGLPNFLRRGGYSLQYTTDKNELNPKYIETGIAIPQNAIVDFEDISDALHGIAIHTNGRFIKDKDYSMLVYEGRIIKLERDKGITINEIKEMFQNTKLELTIKPTRFGEDLRIIDAIEAEKDIAIFKDGTKYDFKYPLLSRNNQVYVSINDVANISGYKVENTGSQITFRNSKAVEGDIKTLVLEKKDGTSNTNDNLIQVLTGMPITQDINGQKETFVPFSILQDLLTEQVIWDANECNFKIEPLDYDPDKKIAK